MNTSKFICTLLIVAIFFGCNSNEDKKAEAAQEEIITDSSSSVSASSDSMHTVINRSLIWTVDQQNPGEEKLKKPENLERSEQSTEETRSRRWVLGGKR